MIKEDGMAVKKSVLNLEKKQGVSACCFSIVLDAVSQLF